MNEHTPGPWTRYSDLGREKIEAESGFIVAVVMDSVSAEANARLIASAPDLLAALEQIAKGEGAFSRDHLTHATNVIEEAKATARDALAKARGSVAPASAASAAPAPAPHSVDDASTREERTHER